MRKARIELCEALNAAWDELLKASDDPLDLLTRKTVLVEELAKSAEPLKTALPEMADCLPAWGKGLARRTRESLREHAEKPETFTLEYVAALQEAKDLSEEEKALLLAQLAQNTAKQFEGALDGQTGKAARILRNAKSIAEKYPDVYRGKFELEAARMRLDQQEFLAKASRKEFESAYDDFLQDPNKVWPDKAKDSQALARAWCADLQEQLAHLAEHANASDAPAVAERMEQDCRKFLKAFPQDAGAAEVSLVELRAGMFSDDNYPAEKAVRQLEAGAGKEKLLLLRQLELIGKRLRPDGETHHARRGQTVAGRDFAIGGRDATAEPAPLMGGRAVQRRCKNHRRGPRSVRGTGQQGGPCASFRGGRPPGRGRLVPQGEGGRREIP